MNTRSIICGFFAAVAAIMPLSSCSSEESEKSLPEAEIPILAWYSIPAEDATLERYQELKECGFTINFSHISNLDDLKTSLDLAEQAGVKVMATCSELQSKTDSVVNQIKDHPALYGYFLCDEPAPASFPMLHDWAERIKAADDTHTLYLNLLPNYVDLNVLKTKTYREYVHRFIEEVGLPLVSFDFYPITFDGIRPMWYENLQDVAEEAAAAGLPFWAFALSTAHDPYPLPTMASLRIQMYTNLAYGASVLQYFTYWNPGGTIWNFHEAPINQNKERSEAYDLVKNMNKELQARAGVFVGSKVVSLAHTGETVPPNCKRLETMPAHVTSLSTTGSDGAVVSLLENGEWNYLVVVSRTMDEPITLDVVFDEKASMVDREGNIVKLAKGQTSFTIEEGDVAIFRFKK